MNKLKKLRQLLGIGSKFISSSKYWDDRYKSGGTSGLGSYGPLAIYKADIINDFIEKHHIQNVVEFGCGDGNQLKLYHFKNYLGYDVSDTVIQGCREEYVGDQYKEFRNLIDYKEKVFDLSISIDVIYHLVEDNVFNDHMNKLFSSSNKYVIIYSSNFDHYLADGKHDHVRHREFTKWIEKNLSDTRLIKHIPNKFSKREDDENTTYADFYIYKKVN